MEQVLSTVGRALDFLAMLATDETAPHRAVDGGSCVAGMLRTHPHHPGWHRRLYTPVHSVHAAAATSGLGHTAVRTTAHPPAGIRCAGVVSPPLLPSSIGQLLYRSHMCRQPWLSRFALLHGSF